MTQADDILLLIEEKARRKFARLKQIYRKEKGFSYENSSEDSL